MVEVGAEIPVPSAKVYPVPEIDTFSPFRLVELIVTTPESETVIPSADETPLNVNRFVSDTAAEYVIEVESLDKVYPAVELDDL